MYEYVCLFIGSYMHIHCMYVRVRVLVHIVLTYYLVILVHRVQMYMNII